MIFSLARSQPKVSLLCVLWYGLLFAQVCRWLAPIEPHIQPPDRDSWTFQTPSMGHHHSAGNSRRNIPPVHGKQRMTLFLLLLSGDIALNPGPRPADISPVATVRCLATGQNRPLCVMPVRYGFTNRVTLCQTVCIMVLAVKTRGNDIVVTPHYGTHSIHGSLVNQTTFTGQPRQTTQGNASAHLLQPYSPAPSALVPTVPPSPTIQVWYLLLAVRCLNTFGLTAGPIPPQGPQSATPHSCLKRRRTGAH